jgi:hypothetical protein
MVGVIGLASLVLWVGPLSAQGGQASTDFATPNIPIDERNGVDGHPIWTVALGQPSVYVNYARRNLGESRYKAAARNLRKAATLLAVRSVNTYGLERKHLLLDAAALRLTAKDVAAGAVANQAQLDSVLNTTHAALREQRAARR